ncbi:MAG TPA: hypothetical protein VID27_07915, partial [Blastocatellia bacterium]
LILIAGLFIAYFLWGSIGAEESYDERYKTATYIGIAVLIPLTFCISFRLIMKEGASTQTLRLDQDESNKDNCQGRENHF